MKTRTGARPRHPKPAWRAGMKAREARPTGRAQCNQCAVSAGNKNS
jgi:hypothetical protein